MEKVYIETSIFSYLTARPSKNLIAAARQQITIDWWEYHCKKYQIYTSNVVIAEASKGDRIRAQARLNKIKGIPRLNITSECQQLAKKLISDSIMPDNACSVPLLN